MDASDIAKTIIEHIEKIKDPEVYKRIISCKNNIYGYDIINRLAIDGQYENAFKVQSADEWKLEGRAIKEKASPIYVAVPSYRTKYIDNKFNSEIDADSLSEDEINIGLKYGVISKEKDMCNIYAKPVFDVKQTFGEDRQGYKFDKPQITKKSIVEMFAAITGCSVASSDRIRYNKDDNILYIDVNSNLDKMLQAISHLLVQYFIKVKLHDIIDEAFDRDETKISKELSEHSITYVINELFCIEYTYDFSILATIQKDIIINTIIFVSACTLDVVNRLSEHNINNSINKSDLVSRANRLLTVLEANEAYIKLKSV